MWHYLERSVCGGNIYFLNRDEQDVEFKSRSCRYSGCENVSIVVQLGG